MYLVMTISSKGPRGCIQFEIVSMCIGDNESCEIEIGIYCSGRYNKGKYWKMKSRIESRKVNNNEKSIVR